MITYITMILNCVNCFSDDLSIPEAIISLAKEIDIIKTSCVNIIYDKICREILLLVPARFCT